MTDRNRFIPIGLMMIIVPVIISAGCIQPDIPAGTGQLEGFVTIGPLCPVEPCHISAEQRAAAYTARHLVITGEGLSPRIYEVPISPGGYFLIELPEGRYQVDIAKNGIDRSPGVPTNVIIKPGETVTINLSVDTGIR